MNAVAPAPASINLPQMRFVAEAVVRLGRGLAGALVVERKLTRAEVVTLRALARLLLARRVASTRAAAA